MTNFRRSGGDADWLISPKSWCGKDLLIFLVLGGCVAYGVIGLIARVAT